MKIVISVKEGLHNQTSIRQMFDLGHLKRQLLQPDIIKVKVKVKSVFSFDVELQIISEIKLMLRLFQLALIAI